MNYISGRSEEEPEIHTYGCSCCSRCEPVTLENLQAAIEYHREKAKYFERALKELKETGKITEFIKSES